MASVDAFFHVRPRLNAVAARSGRTEVVFYVNPRLIAGNTFFNGSTKETSLRAWLPGARVPFAYTEKGEALIFEPSWYRFWEEIATRRLGGINGPTITTIETQIVQAQDAVTSTEQSVAITQQVIVQNAQSMLTQREVSINAGLPGAALIPAPITDFEQ